jgi:predicted TIM-barrel fold metal-dependent hydrolase
LAPSQKWDCHCHVLPEEIVSNLERFGSLDPHFGTLASTKGARFVTGDTLFDDMLEGHVDKAVIFGFAMNDTAANRLQNDYVVSFAGKHPGRFVPLGVVSPSASGFLREAERCLAIGMAGFGETFPSGHGFDMLGKEMSLLAGLCREANVPLMIHVNEQVGHPYPGKGNVDLTEAFTFASKFPENVIVFAHLGGGLPFFFPMPEIRRLRNVYYDTAAQPYLYQPSVYRAMRETGALERIILGSDYPLLNYERYLKELENSGLSEDDVNKVVSVNPEKVYGTFFL